MSPKISIVSGTYNRLALLKEMVESVRVSVGGLDYEIVIVDGGSTDGTLKWCKAQKDIRLIEHGELRGAIKAYNDGLFAARGEYVVVMNDDARLVSDTLVIAANYLDEHPEAGQVAFKNILENDNPERKRASYDQAFGYLYGQCCMTRKWLGDLAGWWGQDYHTYAGDTQLGLRVWELGYKVVAVDGCAVIDRVYSDELRDANGGEKAKADSRMFFELWKDRMPPMSEWHAAAASDIHTKAARKQLRTMRFKAVPHGSAPRRGMIEAFSEYGEARQVNQTELVAKHGRAEFQNIAIGLIKDHRPDLLILQAQGPDNFTPETVAYLRKFFPRMKIVNFNGDARVPVPEFNIAMARECHLSLIVSPDLFAEYARDGARNVAYWPISFEPEFSIERAPQINHKLSPSIVFLGSNYGSEMLPGVSLRREMVRRLIDRNLPLHVYGSGWDKIGVQARQTYEDHAGNALIYAQATLGISISHFDNLWGYSSDRLYMLCATGCPALVKTFKGMQAHGFVDGVTCIAWDTLDELEQKINYYLTHADEREAIGQRGREMTLRRHNWQRRAEDLLNMLRVNAPVGGDHSSTYIANHGLGAGYEQPKRMESPNVAIQRQSGVLPGAQGMTLVEYLGGNYGNEPWHGRYAVYNFSKTQPFAWVDRRDVEELLGKVENMKKLFRVAREQSQNVAV